MASLPTLNQTQLELPGQASFYRGKVREVYRLKNDRLVVIASDRISAFDHILPRLIPFKGQVLNLLAAHFLKATADICPNWLQAVPHPNVSIGRYCKPVKLEMVIRGHLTGHAWRVYRSGERLLCGQHLPKGMKEHDPFPEPVITPATKAEEGHDEDISPEDILRQGIVSPEIYEQLADYTRRLFERGRQMAREQGLILVDAKYEFGLDGDGQITLIDELHTPDSARYFYAEGFKERQAKGAPQKQLSKEFVREWLMEHGFQGLEGQMMPEMPDALVEEISNRYIGLYEQLTGKAFKPELDLDAEALREKILKNL